MKCKTINFKDVTKYYKKIMKSFNIPQWILTQKCSQCEKELGTLSLRAIGLKLNARHIGNFFIEICCQYCNYGYELHMKKSCKNIKDLIVLLKNNNSSIERKMEPDYLIPNEENNLTKYIITEG